MTNANEILNQCASFELRGPSVSLTFVDGNSVEVKKSKTDWSDVVAGKPILDKRNNNLIDLFPRPRAVLQSMFENMERATAGMKPSPKFPGMR